MNTKVKDMTVGNPAKLIILFAVPLMFGNIFQQMYTLTDTAVVGRVAGVKALAALGAVEWVNWMVLGIVTGFAQGFSIIVSQAYGAKDWNRLKKIVGQSYIMMALMAIVVMILSQMSARWLLEFLNTPDDIIEMSILYLRIVYMGIPIISAYNIFAAILRAVGNSKTPLIAMIIAAMVNIGLDIYLVAGLKWGVAGAAIATVTAQCISAIYCFGVIRKIPVIKTRKEDFRPQKELSLNLMKVGTPIAIQNTIIAVGGFAVQFVVNGYGFLFVAGFTATNKLYGLLELACISYGYAVTTYVGQNLGAGKIDRIKKGVFSGSVMAVLTSAIISILMIFAGKSILSLFISGDSQQVSQVLAVAYKYLFIMVSLLWVLYLLYVYRAALQGLGDTFIPLLSGGVELLMRVGVAIFLPKIIGQNGIYYAEISAWIGATILLAVSYFIRIHKISHSQKTSI